MAHKSRIIRILCSDTSQRRVHLCTGREALVGIHVNPLFFASVLLAWVLIYHVVYSLMVIVRDNSLICWSVGLLGISIVQLEEPPLRQSLAQIVTAALALATSVYISLFVLQPGPIVGLGDSVRVRIVAIVLPVVVIVGSHLLVLLRERHFPLWGEARVLARVQRSVATGGVVFFTPAGRLFVRERFDATPGEFLRMVR